MTTVPTHPLDDQLNIEVQLWSRVRQGEQEALVNLYERLYFPLMQYGVRTCGDTERTRDAINDVFLELWDRRLQLRDVANVKSYLLTYLRRKIFGNIREEQKYAAAASRLSDNTEAYELPYESYIVSAQASDEIKERVKRAMASLTPRQQEMVKLRFFEGLSMDAAAKKAGITTKTAYNTLSAALKSLSSGLLTALLYWLLR